MIDKITKCPISEKCKDFGNCEIKNILKNLEIKEKECEELKEHLNQAKYLTEGALRLYSERQNIKYKQALGEIEYQVTELFLGVENKDRTYCEKILNIINKARGNNVNN